jgi:hypothetical protein
MPSWRARMIACKSDARFEANWAKSFHYVEERRQPRRQGMIENRHSRRRLRHERAHVAGVRLPSLHDLICMIAAAISLAIQILVVQTHIHMPARATLPQAIGVTGVAQFVGGASPSAVETAHAPRDRYPINEDPSNCPLCQEFAHSGQFVQSAAVIAYIPAWISIQFVVFSDLRPALLAFSHNWQGRAPPQD